MCVSQDRNTSAVHNTKKNRQCPIRARVAFDGRARRDSIEDLLPPLTITGVRNSPLSDGYVTFMALQVKLNFTNKQTNK